MQIRPKAPTPGDGSVKAGHCREIIWNGIGNIVSHRKKILYEKQIYKTGRLFIIVSDSIMLPMVVREEAISLY